MCLNIPELSRTPYIILEHPRTLSNKYNTAFVQGHVEEASAKKALCRADTLLNMKHGLVRLANVWGVGGGIRPVEYLVSFKDFYLRRYLYHIIFWPFLRTSFPSQNNIDLHSPI